MKKKNKFLYLYVFLFIIFFVSYLSLEKLNSYNIQQKYDENKISEINHLKVKLKYRSIPLLYLENCILKLMSWNFEKEYDCFAYSEINTIRYFVQTLDKKNYYLTDRNKNIGYYELFVIKENLGSFSEQEKKEVFDQFYSFVEKEYLKSDFDFDFYEEKNQNFIHKYLSYLNQFYGSTKKYDTKYKFDLNVNIFNLKLNIFGSKIKLEQIFILIEIFLTSLLSTFVTIIIIRKFYFKK